MNKNLRSWNFLGCQNSVECRTTILYCEFAMTEQSHLRRCDHCQDMRTIFQAHQSVDPHQLLWLKGPAVVVGGVDLGHGVLHRVAPLMQGRWREQQVQLAAGNSSGDSPGGGHFAIAQTRVCCVCREVEDFALETEGSETMW